MRYLIAMLATFGLLMLVPASALALECPEGEVEANGTLASDWPAGASTGRCVPVSEWQNEREVAQQAHEAQERAEASARQQHEAAEAHAREAAENKETGGPPTELHVKVTSVHGTTYKDPGHSLLYVETNEFAEVFFTFTYPQHPHWPADTFHFKERLGQEADPENGENDASLDPWSCRAPMLVEDWEVRVKGEDEGKLESGPGLVEKGRIVDDVSKQWCRVAKKREQRLAARKRAGSPKKTKPKGHSTRA